MKKLLQKAVCAFSALGLAASAVTPFSAFAAEDEFRIYTEAEIGAIMPSIEADYLRYDSTWGTTTFHYVPDQVGALSSVAYYSASNTSYAGNDVAWYYASASDASGIADSNVKIVLHPDLVIQADRAKIGFVTYMYPDSNIIYYYDAAYANFNAQGLNYVMNNSTYLIPTNPSSPAYSHICQIAGVLQGGFTATRFTVGVDMFDVEGGYITYGDLSIITGGSNGGELYIGIICPTTYTRAGSGSVTTSGKITGSVSENSSGGYDVDYDISIDFPDPSLNSGQQAVQDELSNAMNEYHTLEDSLLDGAVSAVDLDSLPDMEYDPDSEEFEDAEPLFSFWNVNVIAVMISWVGIIGFMSYILFGKWV